MFLCIHTAMCSLIYSFTYSFSPLCSNLDNSDLGTKFDAPYTKPETHANLRNKAAGTKTTCEIVYETYCDCFNFISGKWRDNDGTVGEHKYMLPDFHPTRGTISLANQWLGK